MTNLNIIKIITAGLLSMVLTISCSSLPVTNPFQKSENSQQTERGLLMVLDAISFEEGQANLLPTTTEQLNEFTKIIQDAGSKIVLIEGYSDSAGDPNENLILSKRRAEAVRDALIERGIAPNRLIADGFGRSRPVATNNTETGRRKNRRVEIVIINEKAD